MRGKVASKRNIKDTALTKTEARYQILFDHSPISIWEEDFSQVRRYLAGLQFENSKQLLRYFKDNPDKISEALSMIKVVDVNQTSLRAWNHLNKKQLIGSLQVTFEPDNINSFLEEIKAIYDGVLFYQVNNQLVTTENGERRNLSLYWSVIPGHEDDWDQVLVSAIDITDQKVIEKKLAETQISLSKRVNELEKRNHEMSLMSEMLTMLQYTSEVDEAYSVIGKYLNQLYSGLDGSLMVLDEIKRNLTIRYSWGEEQHVIKTFAVSDCWALRTGKAYLSEQGSQPILCNHVQKPNPSSLFCLPIIIDSAPMGCLSLSTKAKTPTIKEEHRRLAMTVVDQIGLALTNIRLKQTLRQQAIHDTLTGLYNRLYLEETFDRELYRQERSNQPLSVLIIDLDHLKSVNDFYGHAAGDAVLRELGNLIKKNIRASDMPCRFGGDEFVLVMPDTKIDTAVRRAERIADVFRQLSIPFGTQTLGEFTLSIGIACAPLHGHTSSDLLEAADKALYEAKRAGRDRVKTAENPSLENLNDFISTK